LRVLQAGQIQITIYYAASFAALVIMAYVLSQLL